MNAKIFSLASSRRPLSRCRLGASSFSMFDAEKTVTPERTVKELEWTNPH